MTAKKSGIEKYQGKFAQAEQRRVDRLGAIRAEIRADSNLSSIERLVYGLTGSIEELEQAQALSRSITRAMHEPLVTVAATEEPWLGHKRTIGQIVGKLAVEGKINVPDDQYPHGQLVVPLRHVLTSRDGTIRVPQLSAETRNVPLASYALSRETGLVVSRPEMVLVGLHNILTAPEFDPVVGGLVAAEMNTLLAAGSSKSV